VGGDGTFQFLQPPRRTVGPLTCRLGRRLQRADAIAQRGDGPKQLEMLPAAGFRFLTHAIQVPHEIFRGLLILVQVAARSRVFALGLRQTLLGGSQPILQIAGPVRHRAQTLAMPLGFLLEFGTAAAAFLRRGLAGGNLFAVSGQFGFQRAEPLACLIDHGTDVLDSLVQRIRRLRSLGRLGAKLRQFPFDSSQFLRQAAPIGDANLGPQLLQPLAVLAVPLGFGCLGSYAAQPAFDLFDDVGQPQQVLLDAFQAALSFQLLGLEATDARRFFEDSAAVLGVGLQQAVHLALFDQAVGVHADARATEHVPDIPQAAGLAVDQVFAFAAAVHPPRNVDFGGVHGESALRVVEHDRGFGGVHRLAAAGARALENHIRHFLAAEALGALLAQHPFEGIDDVGFARAVGTDDHRDPVRELKARLVGKAFEADQFKGFEHDLPQLRKSPDPS